MAEETPVKDKYAAIRPLIEQVEAKIRAITDVSTPLRAERDRLIEERAEVFEAERRLANAIKKAEQTPGPDGLNLADLKNTLAALYRGMGAKGMRAEMATIEGDGGAAE